MSDISDDLREVPVKKSTPYLIAAGFFAFSLLGYTLYEGARMNVFDVEPAKGAIEKPQSLIPDNYKELIRYAIFGK